jgi:hypothetical protein
MKHPFGDRVRAGAVRSTVPASGDAPASHQTVRLDAGRHSGPGDSVCVMELSSMLAGERFSDRPRPVCPTVSALLRAYNDALGERGRQDLYRFASEAVGTREGYELQEIRARFALAWALSRQYRRRRWRVLERWRRTPPRYGSPVDIAEYVVRSLGRHPTAASHKAMLGLIDRVIATRPSGTPAGDTVEAARRQPRCLPYSRARSVGERPG